MAAKLNVQCSLTAHTRHALEGSVRCQLCKKRYHLKHSQTSNYSKLLEIKKKTIKKYSEYVLSTFVNSLFLFSLLLSLLMPIRG